MEDTIPIGLSRQITLAHALEITANNIANQNTTGFRAERTLFQEFLVESNQVDTNNTQDTSLVIDPVSVTDFSQGSLTQTHAPLDFAIAGDGFFAVETQNGVRYTRDGHFGVSPFGELITRNGDTVLDDSGAPILFDPQGGAISLSPEGDLQQNGTLLGRLGVYTFANNQSLQREGNNLFSAAQEATALDIVSVEQGFIENANVQPIRGITNLISISRAYAQASELIETSNELSRDAIRTFTDTA